MKRLVCSVFCGVVLGGALVGCGSAGPYAYLYISTLEATRAVSDAKASGAQKMAPYEYWSAVTYLEMSREKASLADYEDAYNYGKKARDAAKKAKEIAVEKGEEGPAAEREIHAPVQVTTQPVSGGGAQQPAKGSSPPASGATGGSTDPGKGE